MAHRAPRPTRDQLRGILVGAMAGDALGMPVEGMSAPAIRARHGAVRELLPARLGRGTYTDDTQMLIGLAEALLETPGRLDRERVAARFAENYDSARGYGGNTRRVLAAIRAGVDWREAATAHRPPGGSWANGAAMRVAPVAAAFHPDAETVGRAAEAQAEVTGHTHPVGRFGARVQALAVLRALSAGARGEAFDADAFVGDLLGTGPGEYDGPLRWVAGHPAAEPEEAAARLGTGGRASQSVPAALWAFLSCADDAERAIIRAVNLGGDTDTIGAMTGALAGAYHGLGALPARWVEGLEEGDRGRTYALRLADRLAEADRGDGPLDPAARDDKLPG